MSDLTPRPCPKCGTIMIPHFFPGGAKMHCVKCFAEKDPDKE